MKPIKAIRSDADLAAALARIDVLMDADAGTPEGEELDVLTDLVGLYESRSLSFPYPTPVGAIKFRMEQGELAVRDLIPLIGSRSKVSEVLAGKRDITMPMARALHEHLGIPASVLLQRSDEIAAEDDSSKISWDRFPIAALIDAGWIRREGRKSDTPEALLAPLAESGGGLKACNALFRKTRSHRANAKTDTYALIAWSWHVRAQASAMKLEGNYREGSITLEFLRELSKLSRAEDGPVRAQKSLSKHGIALVVAKHLPRTYLDGAALKRDDGCPIVAVTLRFDRIDHFWFCLFHELAHVAMHFGDGSESFFDDLSLEASDDREKEADAYAGNGLIPDGAWKDFYARGDFSPLSVINFADTLSIHPAIVAGRVRFKEQNFRLLSQFVGSGHVRKQLQAA
jgi:HTH-type transcriptional regulator / antitoxin HigA